MKFYIVAVSKMKASSFELLSDLYLSRLKSLGVSVSVVEIQPKSLKSVSDVLTYEASEFRRVLSSISAKPVLLEEKGKLYSSLEFSSFIQKHFLYQHEPVAFLLGGAHGFLSEFSSGISSKLSLSTLTFPHLMARVVLLEQLYRAQCILTGHPYHK